MVLELNEEEKVEWGKRLLSVGGYHKRTAWLFEAPQNFEEVTRGYPSRFRKVRCGPSPKT